MTNGGTAAERRAVVITRASPSLLPNNLSAASLPDPHSGGRVSFAIVHRAKAHVSHSRALEGGGGGASAVGEVPEQAEFASRDTAGRAAAGSSVLITQAKFVHLDRSEKPLLVITSFKGIQMFRENELVFWHALSRATVGGDAGKPPGDMEFARGIAASPSSRLIFVGLSSGEVMAVEAAPQGNCNFKLCDRIANPLRQNSPITDLHADGQLLAAGDEAGVIHVWKCVGPSGNKLITTCSSASNDDVCTSVKMSEAGSMVIGGYSCGKLRLFSLAHPGGGGAQMLVEVDAHAKSVSAIDLAFNLLISASEDTMLRLWKVTGAGGGGNRVDVEHLEAHCMENMMMVGCCILPDSSPSRVSYAVAAFDYCEVHVFSRSL